MLKTPTLTYDSAPPTLADPSLPWTLLDPSATLGVPPRETHAHRGAWDQMGGEHFGFLNQPAAGYKNFASFVTAVLPVLSPERRLSPISPSTP